MVNLPVSECDTSVVHFHTEGSCVRSLTVVTINTPHPQLSDSTLTHKDVHVLLWK